MDWEKANTDQLLNFPYATKLRNRKIINAVFDGLFFRHFLQKNNSVTKAMQ